MSQMAVEDFKVSSKSVPKPVLSKPSTVAIKRKSLQVGTALAKQHPVPNEGE